jgi:N6-L-threonylcarbamoyladenine synthase
MGGCLGVGLNAAKTLAAVLDKPLVGVHHMQAHALTPFLTECTADIPQFPFLTLLISGGHTLLLLANSLTSFRILATTADESLGRVFDKVSRMLNIPWSGIGPGAALERFCATDHPGIELSGIDPPLPHHSMRGQLAFSFSGLHSAIERYITARDGIQNLDLHTKLGLARAFQTTAVSQLEDKLDLGLQWCKRNNVQVRHVIVSGGVASNAFLRGRSVNFVIATPHG